MDKTTNLSKVLLERFRRRSLAHFYLLSHENENFLNEWMQDFLISVLCQEGRDYTSAKRVLEQGHSDILWLKPKEDSYKVENEDFDPLFSAMAHRPLQLPWRFIVVEKPHLIGDVYANKLLKTLEEPNDACTIIFLHSTSKPLMKTVESRAIKLRLPSSGKKFDNNQIKSENLSEYLMQWSLAYPEFYENGLELPKNTYELASELSTMCRGKGHLVEENLMSGILAWASEHVDSASKLAAALDSCNHARLSRAVNNSSAERFATLLHTLTA